MDRARATVVDLSNRSHTPVDLQRCSPCRRWGRSSRGALLVLNLLDFQVDPGSLGFLGDRWGLDFLFVLHLGSLGVRVVRGGPGCPRLGVPGLLSPRLDLSPPVARFVRWPQGSQVGRALPAPPVAPGLLSSRVLLEAPPPSALRPRTEGSGSGWSCNGTNDSG